MSMPPSMRAISSTRASASRVQPGLLTGLLADLPLPVGACGHLRQVRHAEDLSFGTQFAQQTADHFGDAAANTDIDLVEDQRRDACRLTGHHLDGEADAREFAARSHLGQRPRFTSGQTGDAKLDLFKPGGITPFDRQQTDSKRPPASANCCMTWLTSPPSASARWRDRRTSAVQAVHIARGRRGDAPSGGDIGGFAEDAQSLLPARQQGRQLVGSAAEFARTAEDRFDALSTSTRRCGSSSTRLA
jgi:hypothetical protein